MGTRIWPCGLVLACYRERITVRGLEAILRPVTDARTWMLTIGWRRHGLLSLHELPATG